MGDAGACGLEKVNERLQQVKESQSELAEKAKEYKDEQDEQDQEAEKATNLAQAYQLASNAVSSLGSVFSNLGQITDEVGLQAAGIIAQAVATMIQSYTTAAAQAAKMGPWVWAGFALSGLAQVTSVVSQLKSLGSYANGGIITGSSTMGD